jgi:NAD(P)-dependent dehydrogenase (short-subunit alcohol dehydrogenase family)
MNLDELRQLYDMTGKTVVISGGTGVLGGEMACALVGMGADVAMIDRNTALADPLKKRLGCGPGCATAVYADVLDRDSLLKAEEVVLSEFGPPDILINAAGGNSPKATTSPEMSFFDIPAEGFQQVFGLNSLGTVLPCQVFGRGMADRGQGVILNISSMAAYRPMTRVVAYAAAKAAISNFTAWLAAYMATEFNPNIRVNAIAPGFFIGHQNRALLIDEASGELTERGKLILAHTPMGRFGEPEDLLGTVLWLVTDASKFVTGIVVPVDGGFSSFPGV